MTDNVLQPKHYIQGSHECIDEIKAMLTPDEFRGFLKGNIIKYRYRANLKNGKEDLAKADNYAYYLINGHFKKADLNSKNNVNEENEQNEQNEQKSKDDVAFNKLNDLMQEQCIALAVCNLLEGGYIYFNSLKTKKKIYSLIDLTKTKELSSEDQRVTIYRIHFTDGSKMTLFIERGFTLKDYFLTNCHCYSTFASFQS